MKNSFELSENTSDLIRNLNKDIKDEYGNLPQELHKKISELARELLITFDSYENSDIQKMAFLKLVTCTNINFNLYKAIQEKSIITGKVKIIDGN